MASQTGTSWGKTATVVNVDVFQLLPHISGYTEGSYVQSYLGLPDSAFARMSDLNTADGLISFSDQGCNFLRGAVTSALPILRIFNG